MEQQLNELSIFALRELARRTGVNSPTSKKKQQLIDDIIAINNGVKKPHIPKTKQGRPPKTFGYDVNNIFSNKSQSAPSFSKEGSLNQNVDNFNHVSKCELEGVVEIVSNNIGFLWVNKLQDYDCYFIPSVVVEKFPLKSGDFVKAQISFENEQTVVENIVAINDVTDIKSLNKRVDYFDIEHILEKEEIKFSNKFSSCKITKGENTYLYGKDNNVNTNFVIDLLNNCNIENKIYINVSIVEKNKHVLKSIKNSELFISKITDKLETAKRIVNLAIERALRLIEQNKDVLIVVDDALSVAGVDSPELPILKRLVSITKNGKFGSISIVAVMDEDKQINQIEKLADKKISI